MLIKDLLLGAKRVCEAIAAKSTVTTLTLPHHKLGDDGAVELFRWLSTGVGRNYRMQIHDIDLGDNHIGDRGLVALSSYLANNRKLRVLTLSKVIHIFHMSKYEL